VELYLHFPNTPSWRAAQLKHRDNFTFIFIVFFSHLLPIDVFLATVPFVTEQRLEICFEVQSFSRLIFVPV
jgi:hypothetical protein